ncbi:hypothetical protein RB213_005088 [Colletotrichum asianum]
MLQDPKASEKHEKKHSLSYGAWRENTAPIIIIAPSRRTSRTDVPSAAPASSVRRVCLFRRLDMLGRPGTDCTYLTTSASITKHFGVPVLGMSLHQV